MTRPPPPSSPTPRNRTSSRPPTTSREPSTPSPRKFSDRSKYFGSRHAARTQILTEYSANVHSAVQPQEEKSTTQKIGDAVSGTSPLLRSIPLFTFTYSAYHPSSQATTPTESSLKSINGRGCRSHRNPLLASACRNVSLSNSKSYPEMK